MIAGNLEAMIDGVHPADEAHLTAILEETRVMERLIDDLRTVALSEAGTLALHPEPTDPDVLIDEVVRSFAGAAARRRTEVTVTADVPSDLPILELDPVRIREVLVESHRERDPPHAVGRLRDGPSAAVDGTIGS